MLVINSQASGEVKSIVLPAIGLPVPVIRNSARPEIVTVLLVKLAKVRTASWTLSVWACVSRGRSRTSIARRQTQRHRGGGCRRGEGLGSILKHIGERLLSIVAAAAGESR